MEGAPLNYSPEGQNERQEGQTNFHCLNSIMYETLCDPVASDFSNEELRRLDNELFNQIGGSDGLPDARILDRIDNAFDDKGKKHQAIVWLERTFKSYLAGDISKQEAVEVVRKATKGVLDEEGTANSA